MSSDQRTSNSGVEEISCDLCILGAGIAGLNALFVASRYLSPSNRVVLVDRRAGVGGMWLSTYDYVRLHQPHPLFTAGNIPWTFGKERSHLATGAEVLSHLRHCFETLRAQVTVEERFGCEYQSHEEIGGEAGDVIVRCASRERRSTSSAIASACVADRSPTSPAPLRRIEHESCARGPRDTADGMGRAPRSRRA
jgi:hypothetical protein